MNPSLSSRAFLLLSCLFLFGGRMQAGEIEVYNHSFEANDTNLPLNNSGVPAIVDWKKNLAMAGVQDAAFLATVPGAPAAWSDGNYGLVFIGGYNGSVSQETSTMIAVNTTYTIQVDIAGVTNWQGFKVGAALGNISMETGAQATTKDGKVTRSLNYDFTNGGTDLLPESFSTELSNSKATDGDWSTLTITFKTAATVTGTKPLTISLQMGNYAPGNKDNGGYLLYDNVRVTSTP